LNKPAVASQRTRRSGKKVVAAGRKWPLAHIASYRTRFALYVVLLGTLALLLWHAGVYAFLTDDAFISFRYARNLSDGYGLVFNPGFERVEGYTNFLWVLILAGCNAVGFVPENVSHVLTLAFTVILWLVVVWFTLRSAPGGHRVWLAVVPPLFLASTRSVAVWSTSGLETRLFEVLVVGGALRLLVELESQLSGEKPRRPLSAVLFGIATLTRPDGLLMSLSAFAVALVVLRLRRRLRIRTVLIPLGIYACFVLGHLAFRYSYYGDWLPNTYYAKVGGKMWWSLGFAYVGAFLLEYAAYLWIPLLAAAVASYRRRGALYVPVLLGAIMFPHALYIVAIGGDHFEYRPFDVYFPLVFLLLYGGACHLSRGSRAVIGVSVYLAITLIGLVELPYQSHRQFPREEHIAGFPGVAKNEAAAATFMRPRHDPVYRLPGLRIVAEAYRRLLNASTWKFAGIRQEEHRLFLESVVPDGKRLRRLIDEGRVPADIHIAIGSVGAIPYYSDARTLDRTGLTDREVARSEFISEQEWVAHGKSATIDYAREAGADFWALGVHVTWHITDRKFASVFPVADAAADLGDGFYFLGRFPQGLDAARERFPKLELRRPSLFVTFQIGKRLREEGDLAAAARMYRTAARAARHALPNGDRFRVAIDIEYLDCLIEQERFQEAEQYLVPLHVTAEEALGNAHTTTQELRAKLADLYEAWGQTAKVARYRSSAAPSERLDESIP